MDNNAPGRALDALALGRKNYLFAGADAGAERAAAIYSLLGSAKLNGSDPPTWALVMRQIADLLTGSGICCRGICSRAGSSVPAPGLRLEAME
jgi:hypothetical protein